MSFRPLFRSLHFLALVFATISLVCLVFKKKWLEKIAVSVFRCFAVSWFSNALSQSCDPSPLRRSSQLGERGCDVHFLFFYRKELWDVCLVDQHGGLKLMRLGIH